ncbi:MAG TPA: ribosomal protein S18-alanine N-acetyltransferase [Caldilineaceae bacterium]|nr:ribosomal protein S18-alanine N-acetyltransferase [Caldilineaceae bacterium]
MLSPALQRKLTFQPMQLGHLSAIAPIEEASFPTPRSSDLYRRELTDNELARYWVIAPAAMERSLPPILAYAGYWLMGEEAHIVVIATHPTWRRQELGRWLLLELAAAARLQGAFQLTLEVRENNQAARAFYAELGFVAVGLRTRYYTDTGENAHLLTLFGLERGAVWRPLARQLTELRDYFAADPTVVDGQPQ